MDQTYAAVAKDVVARTCECPDGHDPTLYFGEGLWIEAPREVEPGWLYDAKASTFAAPPPPPAPAPVTVVARADLYRRCTEDEAEKVDAALGQQPVRIRRIFESVANFRSDDELWATLHGAAVALFGDKRASELLAASA